MWIQRAQGERVSNFNNFAKRTAYCPYLLSSKTTAKETGLAKSTGKEDPVELDPSLTL